MSVDRDPRETETKPAKRKPRPTLSPPAKKTEDANVATPDWLPSRSVTLAEALAAGGFKARLSGDGKLPVRTRLRQHR